MKDFRECLKENGLKATKARLAVLSLLSGCEQPVSAEEIYRSLQNTAEPTDRSTVYRILEVLSAKKLLREFKLAGENKALFALAQETHRHYLICLKCRKFLPLSHCPLEDYEKTIAEQTQYTITGHSLDLYGYCPECAKKERGDMPGALPPPPLAWDCNGIF